MNLSDKEKAEIKALIDRGEPVPAKYRYLLFAEPHEAELIWPGKTHEVTGVVLPFQSIEQLDEPRVEVEGHVADLFTMDRATGRQSGGWTNKLIWGDNKLVLSSLKSGPLRREIENAGGLKLVYIDPPFDVGADFSYELQVGDDTLTKEPSLIEDIAYRDTWGRGRESYVAMIYERLVLIHALLAPEGSLLVHCDDRVNAHVRFALEDIFGDKAMRNEIKWCYGGGGAPSNYYTKKSDTIFWYSKSDNWTFNQQYRPYTEGTKERGLTAVKGPKYELREEGAQLDDWWADKPVQKILSPTAYENLKYPT